MGTSQRATYRVFVHQSIKSWTPQQEAVTGSQSMNTKGSLLNQQAAIDTPSSMLPTSYCSALHDSRSRCKKLITIPIISKLRQIE